LKQYYPDAIADADNAKMMRDLSLVNPDSHDKAPPVESCDTEEVNKSAKKRPNSDEESSAAPPEKVVILDKDKNNHKPERKDKEKREEKRDKDKHRREDKERREDREKKDKREDKDKREEKDRRDDKEKREEKEKRDDKEKDKREDKEKREDKDKREDGEKREKELPSATKLDSPLAIKSEPKEAPSNGEVKPPVKRQLALNLVPSSPVSKSEPPKNSINLLDQIMAEMNMPPKQFS